MFENLYFGLNLMNLGLISMIAFILYLMIKLSNNQKLIKRLKVLENVNIDFAKRRAEGYPPHYPNGWLPVMESQELKIGQVKLIFDLGNDLVVFRGVSGKVHVLDAYCPHLGANLGVGGTVIGDQIKCPFHGWRFDSEGACSFVPGIENNKLPSANIKSWQNIEMNGFVYIWNNSDESKPDWIIPEHDKLDQYNYSGKHERLVNCHVQDILENISDTNHFDHVHNLYDYINSITLIPKSILKYFRMSYEHKWKTCETSDKHMAQFRVNVNFLSWTFVYRSYHYGPATVIGDIEVDIFGKMIFPIIGAFITLSPLRQRAVIRVYSEPTIKAFLISKILIRIFAAMFENDVPIWNNKRYKWTPILAKNETSLKAFGRWYKQFYPGQSN